MNEAVLIQRNKGGMAKPNWAFNCHIYEPVSFILDLKIGKKDIGQIYTCTTIHRAKDTGSK